MSRDNTLDIVRGSLDEITRPSSNRHRPGSRVSQPGSAGSVERRTNNNVLQSLEVLPPEPNQDVWGADMEVEEYLSSDNERSGEEDEEYVTSEFTDGEQVVPSDSANNVHALQKWKTNNNHDISGDNNGEPGEEILSDEERQIVKDIREEIRNKVKDDMQDELRQYQDKENVEEEEDEFAEIDPKLKEAILKMRKYDRILKKRTTREKTVKRDRVMLQKRLREELDQLDKEGSKQGHDVKVNTERFLALAPPPMYSADPCDDDGGIYTPVFPTQVTDQDGKKTATPHRDQHSGRDSGSINLDDTETTEQTHTKNSQSKKNQDFIKRNIELAQDASNMIAMTDDEKKRIEDLLCDLDAIPDATEDWIGTEMPYQIAVPDGDGFLPEEEERKRLADIDSRLQILLPKEDFEYISSTPRDAKKEAHESMLFTRTDMRSSEDVDKLGEHALKVTKEERDVQQKLRDIEHELARLSDVVEMEIESPALSEGQLQDLLEQCSRTMSRATAQTDSLAQSPRSPSSSRLTVYENVPHLPEEVLQALLAEARGDTCPSSSATTSRDVDHALTDGPLQSISEDTMRELLKDTRTVSRNGSSSVKSDVSAKIEAMTNNLITGRSPSLDSIVHDQRLSNVLLESDSDSDIDIEFLRAKYGEFNLHDLLADSSDDDGMMSPHPPRNERPASSRVRNMSSALKVSSDLD